MSAALEIVRPTLAERQAEWITSLTYDDIPAEVRDRAKLLMLDYLGVARLGLTLPQVKPATYLLEALGTRPEATVLGGGKAAAPYAAYANATFGHSCEFDDSHFDCGHPGVCIIPAVLAVGERTGASGRDLLTAMVAGYQAMVWSMGPINRRTLDIGWHGMKVGGVFGAAAAAAKLLGLSAEQTTHALAIAGSDSSGTMEYDQSGGEVKRFHAGMASRAGVEAAILAQGGLTGPITIFEGLRGIYRVFAENRFTDPKSFWDGSYHLMRTMVKVHPMVGTTHGALDALEMILKDGSIDPEQIKEIEVGLVEWAIPHGAAIVHPHDMLSAQFSLAFAFALRLLRGEVTIGGLLDPANWQDPGLRKMAERIRPVAIAIPPGAVELCGEVTVIMADGSSRSSFQAAPRGHPANPASGDDIIAKFRSTAGAVIPEAAIDRTIQACLGMEDLANAQELFAALG